LQFFYEHGLTVELARRLIGSNDYRSWPTAKHLVEVVDYVGGYDNMLELLNRLESLAVWTTQINQQIQKQQKIAS
jgi:hypothetical protein